MAEHSRSRGEQPPNHASAMGQAEDSRDDARSGSSQEAAGITNRPQAEEDREQEQVPPRGQRRDEGSHA